VGGRPPA